MNDLALLSRNGTLISALDDGHVQLWKHGVLQEDVIHASHPFDNNAAAGVESIAVLDNPSVTTTTTTTAVSFATAGRGMVRLWSHSVEDDTAQEVMAFPTPLPGATSPTSLRHVPIQQQQHRDDNVSPIICLAARYQISRPATTSSQFRLPPQDEAQRQRRAAAQAQEQALQEQLARISKGMQVWFSQYEYFRHQ